MEGGDEGAPSAAVPLAKDAAAEDPTPETLAPQMIGGFMGSGFGSFLPSPFAEEEQPQAGAKRPTKRDKQHVDDGIDSPVETRRKSLLDTHQATLGLLLTQLGSASGAGTGRKRVEFGVAALSEEELVEVVGPAVRRGGGRKKGAGKTAGTKPKRPVAKSKPKREPLHGRTQFVRASGGSEEDEARHHRRSPHHSKSASSAHTHESRPSDRRDRPAHHDHDSSHEHRSPRHDHHYSRPHEDHHSPPHYAANQNHSPHHAAHHSPRTPDHSSHDHFHPREQMGGSSSSTAAAVSRHEEPPRRHHPPSGTSTSRTSSSSSSASSASPASSPASSPSSSRPPSPLLTSASARSDGGSVSSDVHSAPVSDVHSHHTAQHRQHDSHDHRSKHHPKHHAKAKAKRRVPTPAKPPAPRSVLGGDVVISPAVSFRGGGAESSDPGFTLSEEEEDYYTDLGYSTALEESPDRSELHLLREHSEVYLLGAAKGRSETQIVRREESVPPLPLDIDSAAAGYLGYGAKKMPEPRDVVAEERGAAELEKLVPKKEELRPEIAIRGEGMLRPSPGKAGKESRNMSSSHYTPPPSDIWANRVEQEKEEGSGPDVEFETVNFPGSEGRKDHRRRVSFDLDSTFIHHIPDDRYALHKDNLPPELHRELEILQPGDESKPSRAVQMQRKLAEAKTLHKMGHKRPFAFSPASSSPSDPGADFESDVLPASDSEEKRPDLDLVFERVPTKEWTSIGAGTGWLMRGGDRFQPSCREMSDAQSMSPRHVGCTAHVIMSDAQ